jgi:YVTN family beta-propeller protein
MRGRGIAFSADGQTIAIANKVANTVDIINVASMAITHSVAVGPSPHDVEINRGFAFSSNYGDGTVSKVNLKTGAVVATAAVGNEPRRLATSGRRLFVANEGSDSVSVLNTRTMATVRTINVSGSPRGVAVNARGSRLFVANMSGNALVTYGIGRPTMGPPLRPPAPAPMPQHRSNNIKGPNIDVMFVLAEWSF